MSQPDIGSARFDQTVDKILKAYLSISNVSPSFGSLFGGSQVVVAGEGFGEDVDLVNVRFGDIACDVNLITGTRIECPTLVYIATSPH